MDTNEHSDSNNPSKADLQGLRLPVDALNEQLSDEQELNLLESYQSLNIEQAIAGGSEYQDASATTYARQGFRIGELGIMIAYEDGSELIDMPEIFHVPNVPNWFLGITNLHGVVVPVVSLSTYLHVPHNETSSQRLLVLDHGNEAIGVIIDDLPDRLAWTAQNLVEKGTAPKKLLEHVRAACLINKQLWFDVDVSTLLDSLEVALQA